MAAVDGIVLASKFRGCLLGALLGDCLGAPYEGQHFVLKPDLQRYFDEMEASYVEAPVKQYTDDTAMTKCIAESLISQQKLDPEDLAKSKFRGCLLGALLGDCLGAPYEGQHFVLKPDLQRYFDEMEASYVEAPVKQYTDDTAMTKCIAESLISQQKLDPEDLAKRFVKEFFEEKRKGYGQCVVVVFHKLRDQNFADLFAPAKEQFNGSGSFGNGGAMRVAPIPLFFHSDYNNMVDMARLATELTHTNKLGYNGSILQAIAIHQSLYLDPAEKLNVIKFSSDLIEKMSKLEEEEEGLAIDVPYPYQTQLRKMQVLLKKKEGTHGAFVNIFRKYILRKGHDKYDEEVNQTLGNRVAALYSVPTAIFCFLRATEPIPEIETDNPFRRTIQYAISLGGDTDTIASMAGAIAGAFYGYGVINASLQQHCEAAENIIEYADKLHKIATGAQ